jgi:hypothetical protein
VKSVPGINIWKDCTEIRLHNRRLLLYRGKDSIGDVYILRAYKCLSKQELENTPEEIKKTYARGRVKFTEIILSDEALSAIVSAYIEGVPYFKAEGE